MAVFLVLAYLAYPRLKALLNPKKPEGTLQPDRSSIDGKVTYDVNVLLLGVDERKGDVGRSDTMMLLSYNAKTNRLYLMSIPRDSRVRLPRHGYQKINAAYAFGGPDLCKKAVESLTGLYVDYYVKINFTGFVKLVDALSGVDIRIKSRMNYDDPYQDLHIHFTPGVHHLDGEKALEYVRWRQDARADLARVERQREFVDAVVRKLLSPQGLVRLPIVLKTLMDYADTDIPSLELPGLLANMGVAYLKGLKTYTVPGTTATIGDGSYFLPDRSKLDEIISSWNR